MYCCLTITCLVGLNWVAITIAASDHHRRDISNNQFRNHNFINQGDIQGNIYYGLPHSLAPAEAAEVVCIIPYPRNKDLGLGGSGKTQIALDYAYRRYDNNNEYCIFWVHADSEATFTSDYKTIGKKLAINDRLDSFNLLEASRPSTA
ncbi:hypothetical protein V2G26_019065 [Clonostachys chloroleuca]